MSDEERIRDLEKQVRILTEILLTIPVDGQVSEKAEAKRRARSQLGYRLEVEGPILRETDKAVQVPSLLFGEVWVPRSQILDEDEYDDGILFVSRWIALKSGWLNVE